MNSVTLFASFSLFISLSCAGFADIKRDSIVQGVSTLEAQAQARALCESTLSQQDRLWVGLWQSESKTERLQKDFPHALGEGSGKYQENSANCRKLTIRASYAVESFDADRARIRRDARVLHLLISPLTAFVSEFQRGPILKDGEHRILARISAKCEARPAAETATLKKAIQCQKDAKQISQLKRWGDSPDRLSELESLQSGCELAVNEAFALKPTEFVSAQPHQCELIP